MCIFQMLSDQLAISKAKTAEVFRLSTALRLLIHDKTYYDYQEVSNSLVHVVLKSKSTEVLKLLTRFTSGDLRSPVGDVDDARPSSQYDEECSSSPSTCLQLDF